MHRARTYLCAPLGKEEPRYLRVRPEKVALTLISPQSLLTGSVERHAARLAELAATDGDHPDGKVDILAVEAEWLAHPHARDRHESKKRRVGGGSQPGQRRQTLGRLDEPEDFVVAVQAGSLAPVPKG